MLRPADNREMEPGGWWPGRNGGRQILQIDWMGSFCHAMERRKCFREHLISRRIRSCAVRLLNQAIDHSSQPPRSLGFTGYFAVDRE